MKARGLCLHRLAWIWGCHRHTFPNVWAQGYTFPTNVALSIVGLFFGPCSGGAQVFCPLCLECFYFQTPVNLGLISWNLQAGVGIWTRPLYAPISSEVGSKVPHACDASCKWSFIPSIFPFSQADLQVTDLLSWVTQSGIKSQDQWCPSN